MKVRRKKHDKVFSDLVRERANYKCESTGEDKRNDPGTLDCAHIISRRRLITRWHPQNAIALSRGEHMFFTEHPFDWRDFCVEKFGEDYIAELRRIANQTVKWTPKMREEIYQHYRKEYARMLEARLFSQERLEFEPHPLIPMINC